jgi:hypothetical protein
MFGVLMIGALLAATYAVIPSTLGATLSLPHPLIALVIGLALVNGAPIGLAFLEKFVPLFSLAAGDFAGLLAFITGGVFLLAGGNGGLWYGYAPYTCMLAGLLYFFAATPVRRKIPLMMRTAVMALCLFAFWAFPSA